MGINIKVRKWKKSKDIQTFAVTMEKDLRECMRCRFFYGRNSRCAKEKCVREKEIPQPGPDADSICFECPYRKMEGYCFPCMKKLLDAKNGGVGWRISINWLSI